MAGPYSTDLRWPKTDMATTEAVKRAIGSLIFGVPPGHKLVVEASEKQVQVFLRKE